MKSEGRRAGVIIESVSRSVSMPAFLPNSSIFGSWASVIRPFSRAAVTASVIRASVSVSF